MQTPCPEAVNHRVAPTPTGDRQTEEFLEYRSRCQEECGVLLWLSGKARPALASAVSMATSAAAAKPIEAFGMANGSWQCAAYTIEVTIRSRKTGERGLWFEAGDSVDPS